MLHFRAEACPKLWQSLSWRWLAAEAVQPSCPACWQWPQWDFVWLGIAHLCGLLPCQWERCGDVARLYTFLFHKTGFAFLRRCPCICMIASFPQQDGSTSFLSMLHPYFMWPPVCGSCGEEYVKIKAESKASLRSGSADPHCFLLQQLESASQPPCML